MQKTTRENKWSLSVSLIAICNRVGIVRSGPGKPNQGQFMNFSQGHSGTKVQCESCLFSQGKHQDLQKRGEIHELFVLALFLVWFAGATPEIVQTVLF